MSRLEYDVLRLYSNITLSTTNCSVQVDETLHVKLSSPKNYPLQYFSRAFGTIDAYDIFPIATFDKLELLNGQANASVHEKVIQYINTEKSVFMVSWTVVSSTQNVSQDEFIFNLKYSIHGFVDWNEKENIGSRLKFKWNIMFQQLINDFEMNIHIPNSILQGSSDYCYTSQSKLACTVPNAIYTAGENTIVHYKASNISENQERPAIVARITFLTGSAHQNCPSSSMRGRAYAIASLSSSAILLIIVSALTCCIHVKTPCYSLLGFSDISKKDVFRTKKAKINKEKSNNKDFIEGKEIQMDEYK